MEPNNNVKSAGETHLLEESTLKNRLSLRSEMAQDIISRKPGFMEKWSLLIFLCILLLLVGATWFIRYPDIIEVKAILTASNAPKEIMAKQDGRLLKLFYYNNNKVHKNDVLGWLESTANHGEILELSRKVDSSIILLDSGQTEKVSVLFNRQYSNLGEIQPAYREFITALQLYDDYIVNGFYAKKRNMLKKDIETLNKTNETIDAQKKLDEQELKLAEETFNMNKKLFDQKVLSKEDLRIETGKFINKQKIGPQLEAALLANGSQIRARMKDIEQLDHDMAQQQVVFTQSVQSLKSQLDDWKMRFLLISPVDGVVTYVIQFQENQVLHAGRVLGYINQDDNHIYVETNLPQQNFGKIDTSLKVQLRFEAYPYQEVGFVEGTISYVSNIPSDSGFLANIRLDKGLLTNNKKTIPFKNGLRAQGIIITKDMRLFERLYYNLIKSASVGSK